jgi:hypothetical protein
MDVGYVQQAVQDRDPVALIVSRFLGDRSYCVMSAGYCITMCVESGLDYVDVQCIKHLHCTVHQTGPRGNSGTLRMETHRQARPSLVAAAINSSPTARRKKEEDTCPPRGHVYDEWFPPTLPAVKISQYGGGAFPDCSARSDSKVTPVDARDACDARNSTLG